jgi:hypothetical protein
MIVSASCDPVRDFDQPINYLNQATRFTRGTDDP